MEDAVLKEARRLHRLGFAIIWLHPESKRPVESGWTTGERKPWLYLKQTYKTSYNLGVRTGAPSKVGDLYLACIDVDVKDPACEEEALERLKRLLGGVATLPEVRTGSGNGSRHLYCLTKRHFKMITVAKSKQLMPPDKVGGKKRVHAWEICIYSDGRQMALPPSTHPSGQPYEWTSTWESIPEMSFEGLTSAKAGTPIASAEPSDGFDEDFEFEPVDVDLDWLPISDRVLKGIKHGTDIVDRSGFLLPAVSALHGAGLGSGEILSVLTDPAHFLSGCAYDHAQTKDRSRAAYWLWRYTVRKIAAERSAASVFSKVSGADGGGERLTPDEAERQSEELLGEIDWKQHLDRTKERKLRPTVQNVVLILSNDIDRAVVRRNEFAFRDAYSVDTPWGGESDVALTDDDTAKIKHWFGSTWGIEPGSGTISDALTVLACDNAFDPVRDWLEELPAWDGVERLGTWLKDHFEASGDPEYLNQVFTKWMTAMVMRVYRPGAKFDWMPIFEGAQGIGKSSFGRVLVGDRYFLDWLPNLGDKDAALGLQGMWAVEMGELSQFRKNELETIKAFLTRTVDKFRPPHGRKLIESPRRCVFFGTTNRSEYLRDDSGNRRFKPVKVGRLDFDRLRAERDQLFAEARIQAMRSSELDLELTGEARIYETEIHREKMVEDESAMMVDALDDFLKTDPKFDFQKFRISDLFEGVGGALAKWRPDTRNLMFASKALKILGAEPRYLKGRKYWKLPRGGAFSLEGRTTRDLDFF